MLRALELADDSPDLGFRVLDIEPVTSQDGRRLEVLNAGVPGWGTVDAERYLADRGIQYRPDLVVLDFTVVNDVYASEPRRPQLRLGRLRRYAFRILQDHTHFWPFLTTEARFLAARYRGPEAIPVLNPPTAASFYYPLDEDDPHWDIVWNRIKRVADISRDAGARLILVAFPTALQLNTPPHPDTPQRVLRSRAARDGIEFLDLLPEYRRACEVGGPGTCDGYVNQLSVDVWMHPSAYAHRLAAEALARVVASDGAASDERR